jgi:ribonuclease BN (tRNA processing enzyme)
MKLTFLGSGSAFTVGTGNYHSNMLLHDEKGNRLLIDCGSDARLSLHELGLSHRDIQAVYISHLHADHVGGLEWLAFTTRFDPACKNKKVGLYVSEHLVNALWHKVLSGGLSSLQTEIATLASYFIVNPIKENSGFKWLQIDFKIIQTIHIISGFTVIPSYGLMFTLQGKKVFITTDTQFAPAQIKDYYEIADIIFHDCETTVNKSGVHAHYSELATLPAQIKKKIWLYHYNPGALPDAKQDGFRGFVKKGQCFDFDDQNTL